MTTTTAGPLRTFTPCAIRTAPDRVCHEPSHVVLFALGGEFAGREYRPGQHVLTCLRHGADILDARRHLAGQRDSIGQVAGWIAVGNLDRLPLPKLPAHVQPAPAPRPKVWDQATRDRNTGPARARRRADA